MRYATAFICALAALASAVTLFEDCFDDGDANGWTECCDEPDSALYYVQDGWYHMDLDVQTSGGIYAQNGDDTTGTPHVMSCCDYTLYCKSKAWSPTPHVGFGVRTPEDPLYGECYALWLRYNMGDVVIFRHEAGGGYVILDLEPFSLSYGQEYWIRFDVEGDQLCGKVWQGSISDEPLENTLEVVDNTYTDPGSVLVGCQMYDPGSRHAAFDSVLVMGELGLQSDTWGAIKASF